MTDQSILQYDVAYPARLSRLLIFVKWLLVIPHLVVLGLLFLGLSFTTVIAWFAILFTGRYPRGLWNFGTMTLRWAARVSAYVYLQRDEYPPFADESYPVQFWLHYPRRLSRLLIFVKPILIFPHFIILYVLGLIWYVVLFLAWFGILFTGAMPRSLFDFMTGYHRWNWRVSTYILLFTDAYPPFTLAQVPSPTDRTAVGSGGAPAVRF